MQAQSRLLGAVLVLLQGCAAARPVLSDPTEGCMDRRVFARGTTRPELAPGVVALYRRPVGLGVVKLQHLKGGGGFPFQKAGFEVADVKTRSFEVKLHSQRALDSVFTWGLVDACGRFVTEPLFSFIDVRADGGGLAYELLKTADGESELKVWAVELGKGELRPVDLPGLEYAELLADQTVFFRKKSPEGHQALVALADFGVPGKQPFHELTGEAELGFEAPSGPARVGGYGIHQLQDRAMAHFEQPEPAAFFFAKRSPLYRPVTYAWFDRQGRDLAQVFGGDVVEFTWNHFVVRSRAATDTYSLRDAQGALVVPEYRGKPPQFGKDFALVEEASGARRYFDFDLKPMEEARALAMVEERRVREAVDAKQGAEDYARLVKQRQEEAALMAKVRVEQQRVAAIQAEEARKVAEAEANRKRAEAEAERRREEELRSVHYLEGEIVLATDALPKGWPRALATPAKSVTGHYGDSDTGCDLKAGEGNEVWVLCMRFVKHGGPNASTAVFQTGDRPTAYRIRSVQRSDYSFDHVSSGGPEYKLSIGDERFLLVYWEKQGTFHLRIDNHRLDKKSDGLAWGRLF